jgi:cytochrome c553
VYACLCQAPCQAACEFAQACDAKLCDDSAALAPTRSVPASLAETGLYAKAASPNQLPGLAPDVYSYEPAYTLWADGAGKDRFIYIPRCATIDTRDMDHWQFPVGTRLWKHFSVDGKLIETRMLHRYGSGNDDWLMATYGWSAKSPNDPAAALAVLHGEPNAQGTLHDIPDPSACTSCHGKLPDKPLGFGAIQLSHAGPGLTLQSLSDRGMLSVPARDGFPVPGTPVQRAALGYLHANCGGCHNSYGQIPRENPMILRLAVAERSYAATDLVRTTIGVPTINGYPELHDKPRIDPGSPSTSAIYLRMSDRNKFPMPPLATKFPDTDGGVAAIQAWIESLAP